MRLRRETWILLALIAAPVLFLLPGVTWGLPNVRDSETVQSGEQTDRAKFLEQAADDFRSREKGPSAFPLQEAPRGAVISDMPEERLKAYRRFLLFSAHPDEMQVFLGIAAMDPSRGKLNPRLYHYGGAFVYPIAGLLKIASWVGLVELKRDVRFYLANPDEFARFYVVGRLFVLAFYAWGIALLFQIGRIWGGEGWKGLAWGAVGATLFAWFPANVAWALELKPHLPASVLVLAAFRYRSRFWLACLLLGLAAAMSPWFIASWILIVPMNWGADRAWPPKRFAFGVGIALLAFLIMNPYLPADWRTFMAEFQRDSRWYANGLSAQGTAEFLLRPFCAAATPVGLVLLPLLAAFGVYRYGQAGFAWGAALAVPFVWVASAMASRPDDLTRARFGFLFYPFLVLAALSAAIWLWERFRALSVLLCAEVIAAFLLGSWPYVENAVRDADGGGTRRECADWIRTRYPRRGTVVAVRDTLAPCNFPPVSLTYYRIVWLGHPLAAEADPEVLLFVGADEPLLPGYRLVKACKPYRLQVGGWTPGPDMSWTAPEYRVYERIAER